MPSPHHGRRALVTGATGFIGRHLVARLLEQGWEVHAITRPASFTSVLPGRVQTHVDDGSPEAMSCAVEASSPDVCFHLASQIVGQHALGDVEHLVANNVTFGARLAESLARHRPALLINAGTFWQHVDGHRYSPAALYAATKQAFQDVLQYYAEVGGLRVVHLKLFDTYGPGDPRRKMLSLLMHAARTSEELPATPGEQLIDLVHVDDAVQAFILAAVQFASPQGPLFESFAVSSGQPITIRELTARIEAVTGRRVPVRWGAHPYRPREMLTHWHAGDPLPGWRPQVSLDDGLREIWEASREDSPEAASQLTVGVRRRRTS